MQNLNFVLLITIIQMMCILRGLDVNCNEDINSNKKTIIFTKILDSKINLIEKRTKRYLGIPIASPTYWFDMTKESGYVVPFFYGRKANNTSNLNQTQSIFTYYNQNFDS